MQKKLRANSASHELPVPRATNGATAGTAFRPPIGESLGDLAASDEELLTLELRSFSKPLSLRSVCDAAYKGARAATIENPGVAPPTRVLFSNTSK